MSNCSSKGVTGQLFVTEVNYEGIEAANQYVSKIVYEYIDNYAGDIRLENLFNFLLARHVVLTGIEDQIGIGGSASLTLDYARIDKKICRSDKAAYKG